MKLVGRIACLFESLSRVHPLKARVRTGRNRHVSSFPQVKINNMRRNAQQLLAALEACLMQLKTSWQDVPFTGQSAQSRQQ